LPLIELIYLKKSTESTVLTKGINAIRKINLISGSDNKRHMIKEQYKYSEVTAKIIGAAFEVHKLLGNGFQEVIYQRALEKEMGLQGLSFAREYEMPIYYKEEQIGMRRVDFLVDGVISVELKAIIKLEDVHMAQAINYLEAYNLEIGMLINFGAKSLEFKRLINPKFNNQNKNQ
jgi:GxxExxY protein